MGAIEEYEHLFSLESSGFEHLSEAAAMRDRIAEWLETPMGTVADYPSWGHNLLPIKFEPPSVDLEIYVEMQMLYKLPLDIENLTVSEIRVESIDIDLLYIYINFQFGTYKSELSV